MRSPGPNELDRLAARLNFCPKRHDFVSMLTAQFVANNATNAGMASHRSPFTRKNMKPQNPSRLIQVFITLGRFGHAARTMISALSVSRTAGCSNDLTKI